MERARKLIRSRGFWTDVGVIIVAAVLALMMHGMRRNEISPVAYGLMEKVQLICFAALLPALLLGLDWAFAKSIKTERVFLMLFVPLSLLMMGVMPISRVPDEMSHLQRAYLISEGYILPSSEKVRYPANFFDWGDTNNNLTLSQLAQQRSTEFSEEQIEDSSNMATGIYPANSYFPQAMGMAIAKLFTRNRIVILYAARFGAWLLTLLLLYIAIRIAPSESKNILLMISLFPMTLQEVASASADGLTIGVVACMAAFVLQARRQRRLFRRWDILVMVLLALGVVTFKVMYLPYLLMLFLIPQECFDDRKKRRAALMLTVMGALAVILAWGLMCKASFIDTGSSKMGGNILPQLMYVLQYPFRFMKTMIRTIYEEFDILLLQIIGNNLSWFNLMMPSIIIYTMLLMFVAACAGGTSGKTEDYAVRIWTGMLTAAALLIIFLFLYVWWTDYQLDIIWGLQGRYFIPLLFPMIAAVRYGMSGLESLTLGECNSLKVFVFLDIYALMTVMLNTI